VVIICNLECRKVHHNFLNHEAKQGILAAQPAVQRFTDGADIEFHPYLITNISSFVE